MGNSVNTEKFSWHDICNVYSMSGWAEVSAMRFEIGEIDGRRTERIEQAGKGKNPA
jgi:hypothetical protein